MHQIFTESEKRKTQLGSNFICCQSKNVFFLVTVKTSRRLSFSFSHHFFLLFVSIKAWVCGFLCCWRFFCVRVTLMGITLSLSLSHVQLEQGWELKRKPFLKGNEKKNNALFDIDGGPPNGSKIEYLCIKSAIKTALLPTPTKCVSIIQPDGRIMSHCFICSYLDPKERVCSSKHVQDKMHRP